MSGSNVALSGLGSTPTVKAAGVLQNGDRVVLTTDTSTSPYQLLMTIVQADGTVVAQRAITGDLTIGGTGVYDAGHNYESVAVQPLANGDFAIAFADSTTGGSTTDVYLQLYSSAGTPIGSTEQVDTIAANTLNRFPQLAQLANGDIVVNYASDSLSSGGQTGEATILSATGARLVAPFAIASATDPAGSAQTHFLAASGNNFIEIDSPTNNDPYIYTYETYSVSGTTATQTGSGQIGTITTSSALDHVAGLTNGDFAVVLRNGTSPGTSDLAILSGTGATVVGPVAIPAPTAGLNVVALANGGFIVTHDAGAGTPLEGDTYSNTGALVTSNTVLSDYSGTGSFTPVTSAPIEGLVDVVRATTNGTVSVSIYTDPACYLAGTAIVTDRGDVAVETLQRGQLVRTAGGRLRPVTWIGRRSYAGRFLASNPSLHPIRFDAGSLGDGLPRRTLWVSPKHAMLIDGVLVPAQCLVNGVSIVPDRQRSRIDYVHVELESHDVLLAEGAPSESFVDDDSRGMFHNAAEWEQLYPGRKRLPAVFCAPRVESGPELQAIRQRLGGVAQVA